MPKILHLLLFAFAVDSILAAPLTPPPEEPANDIPAVNASTEPGWEDHPVVNAEPTPDSEHAPPGAAATLLKESLYDPDEGPNESR